MKTGRRIDPRKSNWRKHSLIRRCSPFNLMNSRSLARHGLSEARRSVRALRPQALEDATFWEAFESLIKNAAVGTSLQTEFQVRGEMHELPPLAQENLLHIG